MDILDTIKIRLAEEKVKIAKKANDNKRIHYNKCKQNSLKDILTIIVILFFVSALLLIIYYHTLFSMILSLIIFILTLIVSVEIIRRDLYMYIVILLFAIIVCAISFVNFIFCLAFLI